MATWVELALVFQIQTGVKLAPDSLDLKSQETVFRSLVKRIWSRSHFRVSGAKEAIKSVWGPVSSSPACKPLIDHSRSGISRRPVIDNGIWIMVAEVITAAYAKGKCRETFGKAWRVTIKSHGHARWKPEVLKAFNDAIAKKVSRQTTKDEKPDLDGARISLKGPSQFGLTSSSQRANGREAWLTNPQVSWWPGNVTGGVTLCNQCYQVGYRAWQTLSKAPLPDYVQGETEQRPMKRLLSSTAFELAMGDGRSSNQNDVDHLRGR